MLARINPLAAMGQPPETPRSAVRRRRTVAGLWGAKIQCALREICDLQVGRQFRHPTPKIRGSVRAVAITQTLVAALREHRMASPFKTEDALIFCTAKGTPLDGVNLVRRVFKPALRRAKLPEVRFHDLRHSFASLLIAQGEHPKLIAEQLGHASVKITMDRYGHLMDQSYGDASDRLDAALFGTVTLIEREGRSS